jgi:pectinesterase
VLTKNAMLRLTKILFLVSLISTSWTLKNEHKITVATDGSGDFTTIQAAINSLNSDKDSTVQHLIFIKKGTYNERVFIEKNNLILRGPSDGGVEIVQSISRDMYRCEHPDDWGVATVNIRANDVTLQNLTVLNNFGFEAKGDSTFLCNGKEKTTRRDGHQMALRRMPPCTRLRVENCTFRALGGDTVSPWDVEKGMYIFKNCTMEGGVDFYCPRGWSWAENCTFICHNMNAAIWHDGTGNQSAKTVLKNCTFSGDKGYKLGRYHRDAQFYLLDCKFSKDMADAPIYKVRKDTILQWEHRVFYNNCHRENADFQWFANNLTDEEAKKITVETVFEGRWR